MIKKIKYWFYRLQFNHPELFNHEPIHLDLELARACNLQCPFCYRQQNGFAEKFPAKIMSSLDACVKLIEFYNCGFRSVKLNWRGEPLINSWLGWIAKRAREIGYLDIMINTNLTISSENFLRHVDNFTEIRVSLDTVRESLYEKMRTPAKLKTTIKNLAELITRYNPKKTRLIIQRRTDNRTEKQSMFRFDLRALLSEISSDAGEKYLKNAKVISKPVQPRVSTKLEYSNGSKFKVENDKSYFEQWQGGFIDRQYCKQPSQRVVVGVDGKEWTCCLSYNELETFSIKNKKELIDVLNFGGRLVPDATHPCYKCTSFTAYKEKR